MSTNLEQQLDFLRTAASDGLGEALKRHGDETNFSESQGFSSLDDAELQSLYNINKAIADVRVGDNGDATTMSTNNFC